MVNRLVSVGDDFTLPAAVKAADVNLPERLSEPSLSATYAKVLTPIAGETATAATARVNAALIAGSSFGVRRTIKLVGDFVFNAPIVVQSKTHLDLKDATITTPAGWIEDNVIVNAAYYAASTVTGVSTTVGSNVVTGTGFTAALDGKQVAIAGAGHSIYSGTAPLYGTFQYVSATQGNILPVVNVTGTATTNAVVAVTGAVMSVFNRDSDITIDGGTINRLALPTQRPDGNVKHVTLFRRVDRLTLRDTTMFIANAKYGHSIADFTDLVTDNLQYPSVSADGLHLIGPGKGARISNISGTTGDDMFSMTADDFSLYSDTSGDFADITVTNLQANNAITAVKVSRGINRNISALTIDGVHGTTTRRSIAIEDDGTTSGILDLVLRNVTVDAPDAYSVVSIASENAESITIDGFRPNITATRPNNSAVIVVKKSMRNLTVSGVRLKGIGPTGTQWIMFKTEGTDAVQTIQNLTLRDWSYKNAGGNGHYPVYLHTPVNRLNLTNVSVENVSCLVMGDYTAGSLALQTSNVTVLNADSGVRVSNALNWLYANTSIDTYGTYVRTQGGVARTITLNGSGLTGARTPSNSQISPSGSTVAPTVRVLDQSFPIAINGVAGSTGYVVAKNNGDRAYNTDAAAGTVGPVITDGTTWKSLNATGSGGGAAINPDTLTAGETVIDRRLGAKDNIAAAGSGTLLLSYFTAQKTETITKVRVATGATAAGATPTLVRIGIYTADAGSNLVLVASTANDTTLLAAANTMYTVNLSASLAKVAGQRYAVGILIVSSATMPTLRGWQASDTVTSDWVTAPRLTGAVTGLTDLSATETGAPADSTRNVQFALIP